MEQQALVMSIILLAAVAADKAGAVMTDGQFRYQNIFIINSYHASHIMSNQDTEQEKNDSLK